MTTPPATGRPEFLAGELHAGAPGWPAPPMGSRPESRPGPSPSSRVLWAVSAAVARFRVWLARVLWSAAVPAVLLLPLMLATRAGRQGDLTLELSLTTGLLAASLMAIVVVAVSRLRSITKAFGIERVLLSHRWLGLLAVAIVLVHAALVIADRPANVMLLTFVHAPPRARAATGATLALVLLCGLAVGKRHLRVQYETWRKLHVGLAATALVLSGLHVYWLDHLIRDRAMRDWFAGLAGVLLLVMGNRWVVRPLRRIRFGYVIEEVRLESPLTSTLVLMPRHRWQRRLRFRAGQFAWIRVHGAGGRWDEHPFTIASSPHLARRLEFTIRHVGNFTGAVAGLRIGQRVGVDGPHGSFTPDLRPVSRLLLIAGGVGITPMMSILRTLAHRGDRRPITLIAAVRSEDDLLFRAELAQLRSCLQLTLAEIVSQPGPGWHGLTGRVDAVLLAGLIGARRHRSEVDVYICGSAPMVGGVLHALDDLGVPIQRVHTEQFDMV